MEAALMDVGLVEKELAETWRQASNAEHPVMRACMLNLVVATSGHEDVAEATKTIARLSEHSPGRAIVLDTTGAGAEVEAYVSSHCHLRAEGQQVCTEQINLVGGPGSMDVLPAAVLHLLCEDLPVYTWWRRPLDFEDSLLRPLARLSSRFIVDTASHADPAAALAVLSSLASDRSWKGNTGDLAWARLGAWREVLASFFDSALTLPHASRVTAVSVAAGGGAASPGNVTAAGGYLAGWLASRLGFEGGPGRGWTRADGAPVEIHLERDPELPGGEISSARIETKDAPTPATFLAERLSPYRPLVRLTVEIEGTCPLPRIQALDPTEEAWLLCDELERDARDVVFEAALAAGARILGR
jgi:glucose-6-phosphate dehydrogenase assembly protein OpcA